MILDQRRAKILDFIENQGFVSISELAEEFGISESTARRDVEYLDGLSHVVKTRGGASYIGESVTTFDDRRVHALRQKQEVARTVAELLHPGEVVLLDGGTTTFEVAKRVLETSKPLTVATNSIPTINLLFNQPNIELITIGGYVFPKTGVALGPIAVAALQSVRARRLVMSVGGITEQGLFNTNSLLVETERQMMESSDEVWVVADSSKFGKSALARLCPLEAMDRMIVDSGITTEWIKRLEDAKVEVVIVGRSTETLESEITESDQAEF